VQQHLSDDQLAKYRLGKLAGSALLAADDHIVLCEECRKKAAEGSSVESKWANLAESIRQTGEFGTPHISYEQLQAYVDRTATPSDAAQLESHIRECGNCRAEVEDLQQFSASLKVKPTPAARYQRYMVLGTIAAALVIGVIGAFLVWPGRTGIKLAISLRDGGSVIGLDNDGRLSVPAGIPDSDRQALVTALRERTIPVSITENLRSNRSVLLGSVRDENKFRVVRPVGEVVLDDKPEFRWQPLKAARSYRVEVFDSNYNLAVSSPGITGTSWTPDRALQRQKIYVWQVTAKGNGVSSKAPQPPEPEARFQIVGAGEAEGIERARSLTPPGHLLLAIRFANAGLCREALGEISALESANPTSPVLAQIRSNLAGQCKVDTAPH
jgi:hypothetical protein